MSGDTARHNDSVASIILANAQIEIRFDASNGRITAIRNISKELDLITSVLDSPPWRLELDRSREWIEYFTAFSYSLEETGGENRAVTLRWETEFGITLVSRVAIAQDEPSIQFTIAAENRGDYAIDKIEYPFITGVGSLGKPPTSSCLVHSQGTGFLFRDPAHTFLPEIGRKQGLRYSPYPEGFNGSTMQFMAYYAEQKGGFYFATRDHGKAMKWFNFFKDVESAALTVSFMHQNPAVVAGLDFAPEYPVEISALSEGTWYEAAERYKRWAIQQSWTAQGKLADRPQRAHWLLEEVGICTFGINAAHDRSAWLNAFHQMANRPVFHILGPNWARTGQDYMNSIPAGALEEWLPAIFSGENLDTIRRNGDYWGPFEFDLLCSHQGSRSEPVLESRTLLPHQKYSFDRYRFPFMCPATSFWHDFHVARDQQIVADHAPDSIYYDISVNNVLMACRSTHHNHQSGGGAEIVDAYIDMFAGTKAAMAQAAGRYLPLGAEMITELMIPCFDYYQARAEASPVSSFEGDFWRQWLIEGRVEKIPLFAYVYHEYGPTRMDGWAKLSPEIGDIFYWVASRVILWGGLFELNYEFSALEMLDGKNDDPAEHYFHFDSRSYTIDPDKAAFVGEVARARTGWANPYLAYGTMMAPPELEVPMITLDYFLYDCAQHLPHYEEHGKISVPSVVCSAWNYQGEKAAILFVNLQTEVQSVEIPLDLSYCKLKPEQEVSLFQLTDDEATPLGTLQPQQVIPLTLPPRKIVGLEMRPI
jgi:hypothetical protein